MCVEDLFYDITEVINRFRENNIQTYNIDIVCKPDVAKRLVENLFLLNDSDYKFILEYPYNLDEINDFLSKEETLIVSILGSDDGELVFIEGTKHYENSLRDMSSEKEEHFIYINKDIEKYWQDLVDNLGFYNLSFEIVDNFE